MKKGMKKERICKILKDYQGGKLDKNATMEKLGLEDVSELVALFAKYEVHPDDAPSSAYRQSDPSAPHVSEYFTDG
jgi:hypothetical protein